MKTDEQLVAEYRTSRSQQAFAEIVARHAGMVLRACVRIVGGVHEAEDVVQAVFLVLAQRPEAVDRCLTGWLHEVARRTACKVVRSRMRRTHHEMAAGQQMATRQFGTAVIETNADVQEELDSALARLPSRLREAVILRYLEGREQEDAARLAGCPRTTLVARSTEGLNRLHRILSRRGVALSVAALAGLLAREATASAVPVAMVSAISSSLAAGVGVAVTPTALLAKSAVQGIFWAKVKACTAAIVAVTTVGTVATVAGHALLVPKPPSWKAVTVERASLTGHTNEIGSLAFSPDSKLLATGSYDGDAKIWDVATATERRHLKGGAGQVHMVTFSPDGQTLAMACRAQTAKLWDVATGQEKTDFKPPFDLGAFVTFSRDGKLLASSTNNNLKLWEMPTGRELATLQGHTDRVNPGSKFSPDGTLLATGSYDTTVRVWDVARRQERFVLRGHTACVPCLSFSPDGKRLASASWDKTVKIWDLTTGTERMTLPGHTAEVASVVFAPDGSFLVSGSFDKTVKIWDAATGQELTTLTGHSNMVWRVAISPDGKTLASASADRTVKLWGPPKR
jgi:RNA polymerase sigma factor (sigma-70 family)